MNDSAIPPFNSVLQLMQQAQFERAAEGLLLHERAKPADPAIKRLIGRCYVALKRPGEAVTYLTDAFRLAPFEQTNVLEIVQTFIQMDAYPAAIQILGFVAERNPNDFDLVKSLLDVQSAYIKHLEAHSEGDRALRNIHRLLKAHLQGKKIMVDTLQWGTMGGLALDAAIFPKIKAAGHLNQTDPVFLSGEAANQQLLRMISRVVPVAEIPSLGKEQFLGYIPEKSEYFLETGRIKHKLFGKGYESLFDDCFEFYHSTNGRTYYPASQHESIAARSETVSFTTEEQQYARTFMRERMGIPPEAWWVCLYARDPGYYGEDSKSGKFFRNAAVSSYKAAIAHILERGGHVVRVGSGTSIPLDIQHARIFDYAFKCRDQLMDMFLIAQCRFLLGSPSGLTHLAFTFKTRALNVHTINFYPSWGQLYVPKKPRCVRSGKPLRLPEFLQRTYHNPEFWPMWEDGVMQRERLGIEYDENSEGELGDAVEEFFLRLDGKYVESEREFKLRSAFESLTKELPGPYQIRTPISTRFLDKNSYLLD